MSKVIQMRWREEFLARVDHAAEEVGTSRSQYIREAVEQRLDSSGGGSEEPRASRTVTDSEPGRAPSPSTNGHAPGCGCLVCKPSKNP